MLEDGRQAANGKSAAHYRVYGDGKLLYRKSTAGAAEIDVSVRDVQILELAADVHKALDRALALGWASARLER